MKNFPFALLLAASSMVDANDVPVLDLPKEPSATTVKMSIHWGEDSKATLRVVNKSDSPVSFYSDLRELTEKRFLDFPRSGALQLRKEDSTPVKISGEDCNGWWLPNRLNSTIDDPIFSKRGEVPVIPLVKFERCELPADGKMEVPLDCHEVIQAAMRQAKRESPDQSPGYYRIGIPVTVNAPSGVDRHFIVSEWTASSHAQTDTPGKGGDTASYQGFTLRFAGPGTKAGGAILINESDVGIVAMESVLSSLNTLIKSSDKSIKGYMRHFGVEPDGVYEGMGNKGESGFLSCLFHNLDLDESGASKVELSLPNRNFCWRLSKTGDYTTYAAVINVRGSRYKSAMLLIRVETCDLDGKKYAYAIPSGFYVSLR